MHTLMLVHIELSVGSLPTHSHRPLLNTSSLSPGINSKFVNRFFLLRYVVKGKYCKIKSKQTQQNFQV